MSEPGSKTAEELLAALLTGAEHVAVLQFAKDRGLDRDSEVFFMVALLKVFAFILERMLDAVAASAQGRADIEATINAGFAKFHEQLQLDLNALYSTITQSTDTIGVALNRCHEAIGAVREFKDDLRTAIRDAEKAYEAYENLQSQTFGGSLSSVFQRQAERALDAQMPMFNAKLEELFLDMVEKVDRRTRYTNFAVLIAVLGSITAHYFWG